jgi:hypothetical protein
MDAYFIKASTGCSCCRDENFLQGPYLKLEDAQSMAKAMHGSRRLASQYAEAGHYDIYKCPDAEQLPDGRIICGDRIFRAPPTDPDEYYEPDEFRDEGFEWDLEHIEEYGGQTHRWGGERIVK